MSNAARTENLPLFPRRCRGLSPRASTASRPRGRHSSGCSRHRQGLRTGALRRNEREATAPHGLERKGFLTASAAPPSGPKAMGVRPHAPSRRRLRPDPPGRPRAEASAGRRVDRVVRTAPRITGSCSPTTGTPALKWRRPQAVTPAKPSPLACPGAAKTPVNALPTPTTRPRAITPKRSRSGPPDDERASRPALPAGRTRFTAPGARAPRASASRKLTNALIAAGKRERAGEASAFLTRAAWHRTAAR